MFIKQKSHNIMWHLKSLILCIQICNIFCLSSCKTNSYTISQNQLEKIYSSAQNNLNNCNYYQAIKKLETLNKQYPYNSYNSQIYIDLIYAYYKSMSFESTCNIINQCLNLYPNHPNLDYILYIQGLTNMDLYENNIKNNFFSLKETEKNPKYAHRAFRNFSQLISKFPNSPYSLDAKKRLIYLKNHISEYELSIIKYYYIQEAYITVISRSKDMLYYFPDTEATYQALLYMKKAYQKLYLYNQANAVQKIILYNKRK